MTSEIDDLRDVFLYNHLVMEKETLWQLKIDEDLFIVHINYRKRRSLALRYDPEKKEFICNVPRRSKKRDVEDFIVKNVARLKKKVEERKPPSPFEGDYVYLFGEKVLIPGFSLWPMAKKEGFLKDKLIDFLTCNVLIHQKRMGVETEYRIKVRKMKTRWGVNYKAKKTLTFSLSLVHYAKDIIESVVVHELVHDSIRNHSDDFYASLYGYYPLYKEKHDRLMKGKYA